jgi:hypothetical protein
VVERASDLKLENLNMAAETIRSHADKWTIANTLLSLFTAALLALVSWMLLSIVDLKEFKAAGGRFTITDGVAMKKEILSEIRRDWPPRWLTERIDTLGADHVKIYDAIEGHAHPEDHTHQ